MVGSDSEIGFGFGSFPVPLKPTSTLFSIVSFWQEPIFLFSWPGSMASFQWSRIVENGREFSLHWICEVVNGGMGFDKKRR